MRRRVQYRAYVLSTSPGPRAACSNSLLPETNQSYVSIGCFYFRIKPFLYCMDNGTNGPGLAYFAPEARKIKLTFLITQICIETACQIQLEQTENIKNWNLKRSMQQRKSS